MDTFSDLGTIAADLSRDEALDLLSGLRTELSIVQRERDDALAMLRKTQRELSQTQGRAGIGTWERLIDTDELSWSDETYRIHGLNPKSFRPSVQSFLELVVEKDRERVQTSVRSDVSKKRSLPITYRIRRPDGAIRMLHTHAVVEFDDSGNAIRRYGTTRDVTDGRVLGAGLGQRAGQQDSTTSGVFVVSCDVSGVITHTSSGFVELAGHLQVGKSLFEFEPFSTDSILRPVLDRIQESRVFERIEFHYDDSVGNAATYRGLVEPILDNSDLIGYSIFLVKVLDIPDAVSVERLSERSMSEALRVAHIGHWERDLERQESTYSNETLGILGVDKSSFTASPESFIQLVHADDAADVGRAINSCYDKGDPLDIEFRIVRPNGFIRYVLVRGERIGSSDTGLKAVGTLIDVTEQRVLLDSLRRSEVRYASLFEETRRAHDQLLLLSRRLSTVQEEERKRISLDLHDEAGGLLTAIQLSLHMIEPKDDTFEEHIERAERCVDELIHRIHDFSHQLRPTSLDRLGLRKTLLAHFQEFQDRHGISLTVDMKLETETSIGQDIQIAAFRIIQEALNNIARHAFVENASIRIRRTEETLEIDVADKGVGAVSSDGKSPKMKSDSGGNRIGLASMRERALLLGGSLEMQSSAGEGTTLTVRLPL